MKKIVSIIIMCLIIMSFNYSVLAVEKLDRYKKAAENEYLRLYLNKDTTEFAILNKKSNKIWYSNPYDLEKMEKIAQGDSKDYLHSQFKITYFITGDKRLTMDNFNDSVEYNQYKISEINNGIRVDYTLGKRWNKEDYLPAMIKKDRFEELILDNVESPSEREFLLKRYELISLEKNNYAYQINDTLKKIFKDYVPVYNDKGLEGSNFGSDDGFLAYNPGKPDEHEMMNLIIHAIKENNSEIDLSQDIKHEYLEQLKDNKIYILRSDVPKWDFEKMIKIVKETGYTPIEAQRDHKINHLDPPKINKQIFKIPVEYTLEESDFIANIVASEIEYPQEIIDKRGNKTDFPLHSIEFLSFFGATNRQQKGYMFVPDGSGALINFNNQKLDASAYEQKLYGEDFAVMLEEEKVSRHNQSYLPVFGMKDEEKAFLGIIEAGDALASIQADIAGRRNSYNTVGVKFTTIPKGQLALPSTDLSGEEDTLNKMNIYQSRIYQGDLQIRYKFIPDKNSSYVDMAHSYQDYLTNKGLNKLKGSKELPFYLELIGAIDKTEVVMGAPKKVLKPLTTYKQAKKIIKQLQDVGVKNIKLKYNGLLQGGVRHKFPQKFKLEKVLGGQDEFIRFFKYLQENNLGLYPDVSFLNIYKNSLLDRFQVGKDAARFVNQGIAKIYDYNIATYLYEPNDYATILSPAKLDDVIGGFSQEFLEYNIKGLSLREMGRQLNSDFRKDKEELIDRQQSLDIVRDNMKKLNDSGLEIMTNGANGYVIPFVNHVINVPFTSNKFNIVDKSIPFYQIVLHGYLNLATPPVNLGKSYKQVLLKSLETGVSPYYKWSYLDSSILKGTEFDYLLSTGYRDWIDQGIKLYQNLNSVLKEVQNKRIVQHRELLKDVYVTTYENGLSIIVNYNNKEVIVDDLKIPQEGYKILKREGLE